MGYITQKVSLCSESVSKQKKDGHVWPRPRFFWYDTELQKSLKNRWHTNRSVSAAMRSHPSFGMTLTQAIWDLFAWRRPDEDDCWWWCTYNKCFVNHQFNIQYIQAQLLPFNNGGRAVYNIPVWSSSHDKNDGCCSNKFICKWISAIKNWIKLLLFNVCAQLIIFFIQKSTTPYCIDGNEYWY